MPFKSEKQRRYLWANEPEIARDWTDTYGSKIHKADGGRIELRRGGNPHSDGPPSRSSSSSNDRSHDRGGNQHRSRSTPTRSRIQTDRQADFQANPKNYITQDRGGNLPNSTGILGNTIHNISNFYRDNIYDRRPYDLKQRQKFLAKKGLYNLDPVLDEDEYGDPRYSDSDWLTSREGLEHLWGLGYTGGKINPTSGGGEGQPYIWPPVEPVGIAALEDEVIDDDFALNLAAGRFRVPKQYRVAEGGRIPAAFGGIMDSGTGRKAYGFGSVFKSIARIPKKAVKAVKKIAKSPIGKLALGYLATAGLSNYMSGAGGWGSPLGKGSGWLRPGQVWKNLGTTLGGSTIDDGIYSSTDVGKKANLLTKGIKALKNPWVSIPAAAGAAGLMTAKQPVEELESIEGSRSDPEFEAFMRALRAKNPNPFQVRDEYIYSSAEGGRVPAQEGGLMNLGGMEKDYRNEGGFVPIGGEEKADDVPARLSKNEFVFTADAVRNAGGGDIDKGAQVMENVMKNLEAGGKVSEDSQGKGAQEMFEVSERLSEVV